MNRIGFVFVAASIAFLATGRGDAQATVTAPPPAPAIAAGLEFDVASVRQNKTEDEPDGSFPLGPGDIFTPRRRRMKGKVSSGCGSWSDNGGVEVVKSV